MRRGNGVTGNGLEKSRTPSEKKTESCFFWEKGGRVLEQPVTRYPVTPTCWEDELGFHHSSSRAVGGQADMTEKSGEDYLTSGNLRQNLPELRFGDLRLSFCGICGFCCGIMRNLSEFRLIYVRRK